MTTQSKVFSELIGQESAKRILAGALENERLAQTLIFAGPAGVGRKTAALLLASAIHSDNVAPADSLRSQAGFTDTFVFSEILAEMRENKKGIKDAVDEVIRFLGLSPISSKFKVAIIDDCEILSIQAQNALLKTLEEPREDTILILIVEDEKTLLPTIISRSQVVRFSPLKDEEIKSQVPNVSAEILKAAQGSLGFVLKMHENQDVWQETKAMQDFWAGLSSEDTEGRFKWAENMKAREDALNFLQVGARVLRNQLIEQPRIEKSAQLSRVQKTIYQIKDNVNSRAALETLLLVI